jgi:hypothetical protein
MRAHRAVPASIGLALMLGACGGSPPPPPPPPPPKPIAAPAQPPATPAAPATPPTAPALPGPPAPATPASPGTPTAPGTVGAAASSATPAAPGTPGVGADPAVPPDPSPAIPKYQSRGRRDPFETLEVREGAGGLSVAATRLTGIIRSNRSALALIEAPDGIGYILKPGDTLGDGRLLEIGSDSVVFAVTAKAGAPTNRVVLRLATN